MFNRYFLTVLYESNDISWIFDGIGTAIVTGLVGLLLGGTVGYKIGVKKTKIRQSESAGKNSSQIQIGIHKDKD